ncbi:hypothetical protein H257_15697 [Aphanomyces astaci]|uniref:Uncharacterized protein n=1 Tax=Aphanomyces astaci TaxID=112090 RepID=W4FN74_APHAT|nr:hypothetical protein H257_15697 [Aphanomyces astaci]ETV68381.1 hypothetical protein H257_15697 [Aphanomyces astaci]|eukprot:XP_009842176.1 hypothetical protein H257_15697 [Aphanomyces astaci]
MAVADKMKSTWQQNKMVAWAIVGGLAIGAYLYTKPKPKHDDFHGSDSWNKNMDKNSPKK